MATSAFTSSNSVGFSSNASGSGIAGSTFSSQGPTGVQQNRPAMGNSMDMSSLDSLLPSQPKVPMNLMAQQRMPPPVRSQGVMGNMGMMNTPVGMGTGRMMGNQQGMMGSQPGIMGNQQGMMGNQQGMMGGMGMQPMGGQNFMQTQGMMRTTAPQQTTGASLSSQDIDDLLS